MNRGIKILAVFFLAVWLWGTGTVCCYGSTEKDQDKEQSTGTLEYLYTFIKLFLEMWGD